MNNSVVSLIISIDPQGIVTGSLHSYDEITNKEVGNTCQVFQGDVPFDYHESAWMLLILQCF